MTRGATAHRDKSAASQRSAEGEETPSSFVMTADNRTPTVKATNGERWSETEEESDAQISSRAATSAVMPQSSESMTLDTKTMPAVFELASSSGALGGA